LNNKRAKYLRKLARTICITENIGPGDGYNEYNQLENCVCWAAAFADGKPPTWDDPEKDENRLPALDPEGHKLIAPYRRPGTITTAWRFRMIYQNLKRLWKETGGKHEVFTMYQSLI
jgi:hypothetical protein